MKKLTYLFYFGVAGVALSFVGGIVTAVQDYRARESQTPESIVTPAEVDSSAGTSTTEGGVAVPAQPSP